MRRDALNVLHQRVRVLEDVAIDPLQDMKERLAAALESHAVGVVDVAASEGLRFKELAIDLKLACNRSHAICLAHGHSFSGYFPSFTRR
jgi:hypothetical protein